MKKVLLTALVASTILGCKGKEEQQPAPLDNPEIETIDESSCYELVQQRDTIKLHLKTRGINVDGQLAYNNYEKDDNVGRFSGVMKGDTLIADYTYMSEGKTSVREEIFLRRGDYLVKGTGEITEKGNKQCFLDHGAISFESGMHLARVDCK